MEKMKKELRSFKETEKSASKSQLPKFLEMTKAARDEERRNLEFALALQREEVELQNDIIMVEHLGAT
jgi:hypothetical protein